MNTNDFLEAAAILGRRLTTQAVWQGKVCTWTIRRTDSSSRPRASGPPCKRPQVARFTRGPSGIALFLAELYRQTGEPALAVTAEGGIRHALAHGGELPPSSFGYYGGRVGIAHAAVRLADLLDRPRLAAEAGALLSQLAGNERFDRGLDVIAGAAGAIPALLELDQRLASSHSKHSDLQPMAVALGEQLLIVAHREPDGWSWPHDRTVGRAPSHRPSARQRRHRPGIARARRRYR